MSQEIARGDNRHDKSWSWRKEQGCGDVFQGCPERNWREPILRWPPRDLNSREQRFPKREIWCKDISRVDEMYDV